MSNHPYFIVHNGLQMACPDCGKPAREVKALWTDRLHEAPSFCVQVACEYCGWIHVHEFPLDAYHEESYP